MRRLERCLARARRRRAPRGVSAVVVAVVLTAITAFLALAINVGHLFSVRGQLQNASDSAALAGTMELNGTVERLTTAVSFATDFDERHVTDNSVKVEPTAVELGHWTSPAQTCAQFGGVETGISGPDGHRFCLIEGRDETAALHINAVHVDSRRAEGKPGGGGAPVFMSGILSHGPTADVRAEAVAMCGVPCDQCAVPIVFAECALKTMDADGKFQCPPQLVMHNDTIDTFGFTSLSLDAVNPPTVQSILEGSGCRGVYVGDPINVQNGNDLKPSFDLFKALEGKEIVVPVGQFAACGTEKFNGARTVVGFATIIIDHVIINKGDQYSSLCILPGDKNPTLPCMTITTICNKVNTGPADCDFEHYFGTVSTPRLVR